MFNFNEMFPRFDVNENGVVFRDGKELHAFNSNNYKQVILFDKDNKKYTLGVHTVVAMKYLDYYKGCIVHHKDCNRQNNKLSNLEVMSKSNHTRKHIYESDWVHIRKNKEPWNKGKKMSPEFCEKCSVSAIKRHTRERLLYSGVV